MMMSGVISETIGMLPAMKITEPYSPIARAKASAKPVNSAGRTIGNTTRRKLVPARCAERGRGLLEFARQLFQYRLHRAHDEWQPDEGERDHDAERREGDLDAERRQQRPDPSVAR